MRVGLATLVLLAGCRGLFGFEDPTLAPGDGAGDDTDAPVATPQPGGGIGGGPIAGRLTVFALDQVTNQLLDGVTITVGDLQATTDANGRVDFIDGALVGVQTILGAKQGYRAEMWVGVAGAAVTLPLRSIQNPTPRSATLTGTISAFASIPVQHTRVGVVRFSLDDSLKDDSNFIVTPGQMNICTDASCTYTLKSRVGRLAVVAPILDFNDKGTADPSDDTFQIVTYAHATGLVVADAVDQANLALAPVAIASLVDASINFGALPTGMTAVGGISVELGADGVAPLTTSLTPQGPNVKMVPLSLFAGSSYRFVLAAKDAAATSTSSIVQGGQTSSTFVAPAWLPPPDATVTRLGVSWSPATDALVYGLVLREGNRGDVLQILAFDGPSSITYPSGVPLPPGSLEVTALMFGGTFDVTRFGFDADRAKFTLSSTVSSTLN